MPTETKNEAAEGATLTASETQNPTVEVKAQESATTIVESGGEGKPDGTVVSGGGVAEATFTEPVRKITDNVIYLPVDDLKPHPLNEKIYGNDLTPDFVDAVMRNGIYQPLLITAEKLIISGHRRHAAAKELKMLTVPVVTFHTTDELEIKAALVETNKQRVKSYEQVGREFLVLEEVEEERARARMEGGKPVTQGEKGKVRDLVAKRIGNISGVSAKRAAEVVEVIDKLEKSKKMKKAGELRLTLNKNITQAHKAAFEKGGGKQQTQQTGDGNKGARSTSTTTPRAATTSTLSPSPETQVDTDAHEKGLQGAYAAEVFLNHKSATKMNDGQKDQWKKVVEHMVKLLRSVGVAIGTSK